MAASSLPTGVVTFLVTDIQGSTRLYQRLGTGYEAALDAHRAIVRDAIAAHGGAEFGCPGDGFLVAFGSAAAALRAAVDAQRGFARHEWPEGVDVRVRMGLHTGEARVTTTGGTYTGFALHEAARIGGAGHGGQVVASEACVSAAGGELPAGVSLADLGEHTLKDLEGARRLYQVSIEGLADAFPPLRTVPRTSLPSSRTSIVGRDDDLAAIVQSLAAGARLLTLVGPGGVGKTTLGLEAARTRASAGNDTWLVELAPLPPTATVDEVATAVGRGAGIDVADLESVASVLATRSGLVVVDNCEHVLDAAAAVVSECLARCPSLAFVATSQAPLGIRGEQLRHVTPLSPADAAALFVSRARDVRPSFSAEDESSAITNICARLDGLPLAIELAARRARSMSPAEIDARLDSRFRLLTGGDRDADPRQQRLEAAIDWSHDLLGEDERVVFRRLAGFVGGFTLAAAEDVCGFAPLADLDVANIVATLVDRSLVSTNERAESIRFSMLESIRAYATDRLRDAGEVDAVRSRHLAWVANTCRSFLADITHGGGMSLAALVDEAANVRAAVGWALDGGDPEEGLAVVAGAGIFGMEIGGDVYYAVPGWADALLATGAGDPALRAQVMLSAGNAASGSRNVPKLQMLAESAMALVQHHGLRGELESQALAMLGFVELHAGHSDSALHILRQATDAAIAAGATGFGVWCHTFVAEAALLQNDLEAARLAAEEAIDLGRRVGESTGTARALIRLASVNKKEGNRAEAEALLLEAAATAQAAHALSEAGSAHGELAELHFRAGDTKTGHDHLTKAITLFENVGQWFGVAQCRKGAAQVALARGDERTAERELAATADALERTGIPTAVAFFDLADAAAAHGRVDVASQWVNEGVERARRAGDDDLVAQGEARLASLPRA